MMLMEFLLSVCRMLPACLSLISSSKAAKQALVGPGRCRQTLVGAAGGLAVFYLGAGRLYAARPEFADALISLRASQESRPLLAGPARKTL